MEQGSVENHKKGRIRRKYIKSTILTQMHFYFSDANLAKNRFLSDKIKESEYVPLSVFLSFNKISKLTSSIEEIAKALKQSDFLQLNEDHTQVKRCTPPSIKTNEEACTIYVQTLPPDITHEWLMDIFSEFGTVDYVSLPKYSHNKLAKGFAFIEYQNEEQVKCALDYFSSIGGRISTQIDAEELCSNKTNEENVGANKELNEPTNEKKRKHSLDESSQDTNKKLKSHDADEIEDGKQKKKGTKKKLLIKEMGLQVLPKAEWKRMRNCYWDMQRKKMKQLKQHLTKCQLHQNNYLEQRPTEQQVVKSVDEDSTGFVPGVIVKLKLSEAWTEAKKIRTELKNITNAILYVEVPVTVNSDEVYLRFIDAESARQFCVANSMGIGTVLAQDEEKHYWEKIQLNRDAQKRKEGKKQRGRDKLLKRAERELGKHIRFDDTDE